MDETPCLNRGVRELEIANDGRSRSVTGHVVKSRAVVAPANCCNVGQDQSPILADPPTPADQGDTLQEFTDDPQPAADKIGPK
jgi:hypothetical protein